MAELLQFDPTSEDAANSPLSVMDASYRVLAHAYPAPQLNVLYASSVDTEGELPASRRYSNRQITMTIEMVDATGSLTRALQAKVAKIAREGGTLKRTLATGQVIVFDLLSAEQFDPTFDIAYYSGNLVKVDLVFAAKPFGRGTAVTLSAHTESTLPCLVFTETGITGDVPALGKLVISEAQAQDQWFVAWGIQSRYYSSSTNAALFYEAETRTPMNGAATAVGATGASGSGSNVVRHSDLSTAYQGILSTQASGAGSHLSHVGDFQVWARVYVPATNTGTVSVALEWAQSDLTRWTRNADASTTPDIVGAFYLLNLGQVSLRTADQGTQRWEGRVLAKSTVTGDDVDIDCLMFAPVIEGYGEARASMATTSSVPSLARDDFNQTAGNLSGKTLPVGGTWTTAAFDAGGTVDFVIDATSHSLARTDVVAGARARVAHNNTNYTNVAVQCDMLLGTTAAPTSPGITARYTDANNCIFVQASPGQFGIAAVAAGVAKIFTTVAVPGISEATWVTVRLTVDAAGRFAVYMGPKGYEPEFQMAAQSADLATGGTLATGKAGILDGGGPTARYYDDFRLWTPVSDPALCASQSLEVRHDRVIRESGDGTAWASASRYEGSYLRLPPAGAEGRSLRVFVKASRTDPDVSVDTAIDDITAQLVYVPRYLVIP